MGELREGGCQCGGIRYRINDEVSRVAICHCSECQRQSGSAFGMSLPVAKNKLEVRGTLKTFTRSADSGRKLVCAFCPDCGTRIYHEPGYAQGIVNIKPGTLDDTSLLRPTIEVWAERKHAWVTLASEIASHSKQPW